MTQPDPSKPPGIALRPVDELKISPATLQVLKEGNVYYIGDLMQRTQAELLQWPKISKRSLLEIRKALQAHGLDLGMG